jgi:hypothetical protein
MKNLGKIIIFLHFFYSILNAEVSIDAYVDKENVALGDSVVFNLKINGNDKEGSIPNILRLGGYKIDQKAQSTSIQMINGDIKKMQKFTYTFTPSKNTIIEPIKIKIAGKIYTTKKIAIRVLKNHNNEEKGFKLTIKAEKKNLYVGEPFLVNLLYQQKLSVSILDIKLINAPGKENFWVKKQGKEEERKTNNLKIVKIPYVYSAQKAGRLNISEAQIKVATPVPQRDSWGMFVQSNKWNTLISQAVSVKVKPLPDGINFVGDLSLKVKIDKQEVKANEAVNIEYYISGKANVEDIPKIDFNIDNATVFSEDKEVKHYIESGKYRGTFIQKIAIVATSDYTIPAFDLKYFNTKSKTIQTLHFDATNIKVTGGTLKQKIEPIEIEKSPFGSKEDIQVQKGFSTWLALSIIFIVGVLVGLFLAYLFYKQPSKHYKKQRDLKYKYDQKYLLKLFLPFANSTQEIDTMINQLSENIYEGKNHIIDKKLSKKLFDDVYVP